MLRPVLLFCLISSALVLLSGCLGPSRAAGNTVKTLPIFSSHLCRNLGDVPSVRWLANEQELQALLRNIGAGQAQGIDTRLTTDESAVLIFMGQKTSAGYALAPGAEKPRLVDTTLTIPIQWQEPAPGAITAQMLTSPCLVLRLEVAGKLVERVRVVDQEGTVRANFP